MVVFDNRLSTTEPHLMFSVSLDLTHSAVKEIHLYLSFERGLHATRQYLSPNCRMGMSYGGRYMQYYCHGDNRGRDHVPPPRPLRAQPGRFPGFDHKHRPLNLHARFLSVNLGHAWLEDPYLVWYKNLVAHRHVVGSAELRTAFAVV